MAFGITGVSAPAQTGSANPIPELSPATPTAGTPSAKPTPMPVDTMTRGEATTNPDAYHDAIVKFTGGPEALEHPVSATSHTATMSAPAATLSASHTASTNRVTSHAASIAHPAATTHAQATSVSSTGHPTRSDHSVADTSPAAKASMPVDMVTTTAALSRGSAIAEGALEFNPATAFATLAGGAVIAGTQGPLPVSREQATAIGEAENKQFGGGTSDHVFSPFSNLKADQALPTQAELDARSKAAGQLAPQPQAGPAPTAFAAHPSGSSTTISPPGEPRSIEHTGNSAPPVAKFQNSSKPIEHVENSTTTTPAHSVDRASPVSGKPVGPTVNAADHATLKVDAHDVRQQYLPGWTVGQTTVTKTDSNAARRAFEAKNGSNGSKESYVKDLAKNHADQLKAAGIPDAEIEKMTNGFVPDGYNVHHVVSLSQGGANDPVNFVLVRDSPEHRKITGQQNSAMAGMKYGDTRNVDVLYPPKGTVIYKGTP